MFAQNNPTFPERSRILSPTWLTSDDRPDPWVLVGDDPTSDDWWDAILGNGTLGVRIGRSGDGSSFQPASQHDTQTGCRVHGLWGDDQLLDVPRWHELAISCDHTTITDDVESYSNYEQKLDLRTGILSTRFTWEGPVRCLVESECRLCKDVVGTFVIETTVKPEADCELVFHDRLYSEGVDRFTKYRLGAGEDDITMLARMSHRLRRVGLVSQVRCENARSAVFENDNPFESSIRICRDLMVRASAGETIRVTKVGGIAIDGDNPVETARSLVARAFSDLPGAKTRHEAAWEELWEHRIEVENPRVHVLLNASLYYFYAQVPTDRAVAVGPSGLASKHWHGRAFWDADLWMFPVLCLLNPAMGRCFTQYRHDTLPGARRNAEATGFRGGGYAWESAEFGDEYVPPRFIHHQRHVVSCVALAQWWDVLVSGDDDYLKHQAADVITSCADYWKSRVTWVEENERYELLFVKCPDEFAGIQDNNAATCYGAAWTLRLASHVCDLTGLDPDPEWMKIADKIWVPFDEELQVYIEYEGFNQFGEYDKKQKFIKQADTSLLVYPFDMPMTDEVKRNIIERYRKYYPDDKIMMSSAFDAIVACDFGDSEEAFHLFEDLLCHFRYPYFSVTEQPINDINCFLTGIGGLLQTIVMGFVGLRLHEGELRVKPCVPAEVGTIRLHNITYAGRQFSLEADANGARIIAGDAPVKFDA